MHRDLESNAGENWAKKFSQKWPRRSVLPVKSPGRRKQSVVHAPTAFSKKKTLTAEPSWERVQKRATDVSPCGSAWPFVKLVKFA